MILESEKKKEKILLFHIKESSDGSFQPSPSSIAALLVTDFNAVVFH